MGENASCLGHGFAQQDAWHDGVLWKMASKEGFVYRHIFERDDASPWFDLNYAVNEEEGVSMRQDRRDRKCIFHHDGSRHTFGLFARVAL